MKRKLSIAIGIALAVLIIPIALCVKSTEPAKDSIHLEWAVKDDMTLDEVYNLMAPELKENTLIYPALSIIEVGDGKWDFVAKSNAAPGDTDATYLVLAVFPQVPAQDYYSTCPSGLHTTDHSGWIHDPTSSDKSGDSRDCLLYCRKGYEYPHDFQFHGMNPGASDNQHHLCIAIYL